MSAVIVERDWGFPVYEGKEPFGFISYKREDSLIVAKYAKALYNKGVNLWYDYGIPPGKWEETISEKLMIASYLVIFVTKLTFLSDEIKKEVNTAKARGIEIIPVFLENVDTSQINPKKATFMIELQTMQGIPAFNRWNEQDVADELLRLITNKTESDDNIGRTLNQQLTENNRKLLTGQELFDCVSMLYDTEQSLVCQKKAMINLIAKSNELGKEQIISKPIEPHKTEYPIDVSLPKPVYPKLSYQSASNRTFVFNVYKLTKPDDGHDEMDWYIQDSLITICEIVGCWIVGFFGVCMGLGQQFTEIFSNYFLSPILLGYFILINLLLLISFSLIDVMFYHYGNLYRVPFLMGMEHWQQLYLI